MTRPPIQDEGRSDGIDVESLRSMLERHDPVTVLDIRPAIERAEWSIPGSVYRDAYEELRAGHFAVLDEVAIPSDRPVVAVCAKGRTSRIAAAELRRRGFDAASLVGGMQAWSLAWNTAEVAAPDATLIQFRRTGKGCLSYLVASGSEALVVDASIAPEAYLGIAAARGWTIRHVLDTHIHADHLSRGRALSERVAKLWLPEQGRARFPHETVREGAPIPLGAITLRALPTPGHTLESTSYLVAERWLLTGDTLFLSAVGRPDLEASAEESRVRALLLHRSLGKLFDLDPALVVLPSHADTPVPFDERVLAATLAEVRAAVRVPEDAQEFADYVLRRIPAAPANHHVIVGLNETGELPAGDPTDLEAGANRCAIVENPGL